MLHTRKAQSEATMRAMAARNAYRAEIVKRAMGEKYTGHQANYVKKLPAQAVQLIEFKTASNY